MHLSVAQTCKRCPLTMNVSCCHVLCAPLLFWVIQHITHLIYVLHEPLCTPKATLFSLGPFSYSHPHPLSMSNTSMACSWWIVIMMMGGCMYCLRRKMAGTKLVASFPSTYVSWDRRNGTYLGWTPGEMAGKYSIGLPTRIKHGERSTGLHSC